MPSGLVPSVTYARSETRPETPPPPLPRTTRTPPSLGSQVTVTVAMTLTGDQALRAADEVKDSLWRLARCLPAGASVVNVATTVAAVHADQEPVTPAPLRMSAVPGRPPAARDRADGSDDAQPSPSAGEVPPLMMFPASRIATLEDDPVPLTRREFDLLLHLARHPGRVFTRQQLSIAVWQEDFMRGERTIDVHIHRLRLKLARRGPVITTVRGVGYRLDAAGRVLVVSEAVDAGPS